MRAKRFFTKDHKVRPIGSNDIKSYHFGAAEPPEPSEVKLEIQSTWRVNKESQIVGKLWTATLRGRQVGHLFTNWLPEGQEVDMLVDPAYRNLGFGTALLEQFAKDIKEDSGTDVRLLLMSPIAGHWRDKVLVILSDFEVVERA